MPELGMASCRRKGNVSVELPIFPFHLPIFPIFTQAETHSYHATTADQPAFQVPDKHGHGTNSPPVTRLPLKPAVASAVIGSPSLSNLNDDNIEVSMTLVAGERRIPIVAPLFFTGSWPACISALPVPVKYPVDPPHIRSSPPQYPFASDCLYTIISVDSSVEIHQHDRVLHQGDSNSPLA